MSKLEYDLDYNKKNIKQVKINFNINNEEDIEILSYLQNKSNKQQFIKQALKLLIEKEKDS